MSETQGSGDDSSTSSDVVDSVSQDLSSAASFTILIHGVGAETSQGLLAEATRGYLASGFGNSVVQTKLSECPALSQEKGAEAILIKGQKGGHFVIALPWNNRTRLAPIALICLILLSLLMAMMTVDPWKILLFKTIGDLSIRERLLAIILSLCAKWTIILWSPWLWVFASLLVAALWIIASVVIVPCVSIARTTAWRLTLGMLFIAVTFISLASVHTIWFVSHKISTDNLTKPKLADLIKRPTLADLRRTLADLPGIREFLIESEAERVDRINPAKARQVAPPDLPTVEGPGSDDKVRSKIEQILSHIKNPSDTKHSEFVTCLLLILICIVVVAFAEGFGWVLDLGLDVLHYGDDEKYDARKFDRLSDTIRWLHSQAPNAYLTVVAHSLGTVIASQTLSSMSDSEPLPSQITLITLGSPLNYLHRVFPDVLNSPRKLSAAICSKARWVNLWRRSDWIGKELDVEPGVLVQYCIGEGYHPDYWKDGVVWKAVVYESLELGEFSGKASPPGNPARCCLEVHLGRIAALAIVLLLIVAIVVWSLPYLIYWHYHARH